MAKKMKKVAINITDLRSLYQMLSKEAIIQSDDIDTYLYSSELSEYKFKISFFKIDRLTLGTFIPTISNEEDVIITFDLHVEISFDTSSSTDIISALNVTITQTIIGELEDKELIIAKSGWHLDKDLGKDVNPKFYHPLYHMHFGGSHLTTDEDLKDSKVAVFGAPRLIHPPLDGVLAIDFVLRNFYSNTTQIKDIINDIDYIRIINNARELYWKPYYEAIANYWGSRKNEDLYLIYGKTLIDNSIYFKNQKTR